MSDSMPAADADDQAQPHADDSGPAPLGVDRAPTGHPGVDALVERLGDVDHLGTDGHLEVYEDVHRGLRTTLTALDAPQGPPAPGTSGAARPLADQRL
ncbi:hypothetical protein [Streptomyces sp. NBC_00083]|uniref:hypothetical protein n=1 Tax=Streptomyces sp. NBC_00083 TaxID=2975647 RepID=UPI00225689CE|nr:hypothetical protein [Streptomyces sp. NBC_00083]MCX5383273.1 hypothetical protein [Streptomyces sp. NBC_00083]